MQEQFILFLYASDIVRPSWAIVTAEGKVRQHALHDDATGLSQLAQDKQVIVIVPGEEVLLTHANLPKMSHARLLKAIPFALEEELGQDVEALHFALAPTQTDDALSIAVVSREKMQSWLALLKEWSISPDLLVPSSLSLPFNELTWSVSITEVALVRTGFYQGFVCDTESIATLLPLAFENAAIKPAKINCYTPNDIAFSIESEMKRMNEAEQLTLMAETVAKQTSLNLLQGIYTLKKQKSSSFVSMRKTIVSLAITWLVLLFAYPLVSYFILKSRLNAIDTQIAMIYKCYFPQSKQIIAPKLRLEEKLHQATATESNQLLSLLTQVGSGLAKNTNVKLTRFDYQHNQLILTLTAASSDDFTAFTDYLSSQGLTVKQQNATLTGDRIDATLLVE